VSFIAAFFAYLVAVTLKALQQRHVQHAEYLKMPAVSYGMAACEVFITYSVIKTFPDVWGLALLILAIGSGGAIGSILGTWLHARKH
jgi:ABC-type phosphate/phosphonate transport system permease subunit